MTWAPCPTAWLAAGSGTTSEAHTLFEEVWGAPLPEKVGKNQAEIVEAVENGDIQCMYVIGENLVQSDANEHHHEHLFSALDFLVVQDIFLL